jgi:hypothetical protein
MYHPLGKNESLHESKVNLEGSWINYKNKYIV